VNSLRVPYGDNDMRIQATKRRGENNGGGWVVGLLIVGVCLYFAWNKKHNPPPPLKPLDPELLNPLPTPRTLLPNVPVPAFGFGGNYRGLLFGATFEPNDLVIKIVAGAGIGAVGISMPVIVLSIKEWSVIFVPEFDATLSVKIGKYQGLSYSFANGLGREFGTEFPALKGQLIFSASVGVPTSPGLSPAGSGMLRFQQDRWTFTPSRLTSSSLGTDSLLRVDSLLAAPKTPILLPSHVTWIAALSGYLPDKGYTWMDGSIGSRQTDLEVQWNPGQVSFFPPHISASVAEGSWEPDPGYTWSDGTQRPLSTIDSASRFVAWTPGIASSRLPNIVASRKKAGGRRPSATPGPPTMVITCRYVS
jgi:hypothetical protein